MPATRPPRSAVRAAVRAALVDLGAGDRVLVALSGGPDSLALLAATIVVAAERGLVCAAVVVDHGLQAGSAEVAARAAEQARILGCADARVVAVDVAAGPGSGGPEGAARAARYAALDREASGTAAPGTVAVLLGHTRDDQAETVLLGLARGSGTRSLAGMPERAGRYRRPLLGLPRALVADAAAEAAREDPRLAPWTDPHNADAAFARVRVREQVLPVLEQALGPGVAEALARTAGLAREDAEALDGWADALWASIIVAGLPGAAPLPEPAAEPPGGPGPDGVRGSRRQGAKSRQGAAAGHDTQGRPRVAASSGAEAVTAGPGAVVGRLDVSLLTRGEGGPGTLPAAIRTRLVIRFLLAAGCPPGTLAAAHVRGVTALLDAPGSRAEIALPGALRARREGGALVVRA